MLRNLIITATICLYSGLDQGRSIMPLVIQAKIIETEKFADILKEADAKTLVLFDIDDTMINTTSTLGSTAWWNYFMGKGREAGLEPNECTIEMNRVIGKIILSVPIETNEKDTAVTIKQLQDRGILTLGLTARHNNPSFLPSADIVIYNALAKLGIDFSKAKLPQQPNSEVNKIFSNGIIFTNHELKGPYLQKFLQEMGMHPDKVVFIDDSLKQLKSVEQTLESMDIPFVGFHYRYVEMHNPKFNPLIGNIELEYLLERDQVLSDSEAEVIAEKMGGCDPDYYVKKLIQILYLNRRYIYFGLGQGRSMH
jgi:hypothetical protein